LDDLFWAEGAISEEHFSRDLKVVLLRKDGVSLSADAWGVEVVRILLKLGGIKAAHLGVLSINHRLGTA